MDEGDRSRGVQRKRMGARRRVTRLQSSLDRELTPDRKFSNRASPLEARVQSLRRKLASALASNRYLRLSREKIYLKLQAKRAQLKKEKAVTRALLGDAPDATEGHEVEILRAAVNHMRSELARKDKRIRKNAKREKKRRVKALRQSLKPAGEYVAYAYIGGENQAISLRVYIAVVDVLHALGVARVELIEAEHGSLIVKVRAWFARLVSDETTRAFADQMLQTAEALTVDKAQAESDSKRMAAIAQMVEAGAKADSLVIDLGTLQYAQFRDEDGTLHVAARSVSSRDLATQRVSAENRANARAAYEEIAGSPGGGSIEVGGVAE